MDFETFIKKQGMLRVKSSYKDVLKFTLDIALVAAGVMLALNWNTMMPSVRYSCGAAYVVFLAVFIGTMAFDMVSSYKRRL